MMIKNEYMESLKKQMDDYKSGGVSPCPLSDVEVTALGLWEISDMQIFTGMSVFNEEQKKEFLNILRAAGISEFVVSNDCPAFDKEVDAYVKSGCTVIGSCFGRVKSCLGWKYDNGLMLHVG